MIEILHEDECLIVLNKPAGIATLSKSAGIHSLSEELVLILPKLNGIPDKGIAHRLDNDTSGIICAGKTTEIYKNIRAQFADGTVTKHYTALVLGGAPERDTIDAPVAHHPRKKTKMVVCESEDRSMELKARPAHTHYETVVRYAYDDTAYTLLDVVISTGVRHQIRAHLAWKGFPLAGDRLYQNTKKRAEDVLPLKRHFLHASKLEIDHPISNKRITFESPLPKELKQVISSMKKL